MNCSRCGRESHGGYCDCMIKCGEFKGAWWDEEKEKEDEKMEIGDIVKVRDSFSDSLEGKIEEFRGGNTLVKVEGVGIVRTSDCVRQEALQVNTEQLEGIKKYYEKCLDGMSGELGAREADGIVTTLNLLGIELSELYPDEE